MSKKVGLIIALAVVVICGISVAIYLLTGSAAVAEVNGEKISEEEYTNFMENLMVIYEQQGYTLENDEKAAMADTLIDEMVDQKITEQAAKELKCYPTEKEIEDYFEEQLAVSFGDATTARNYIKESGVDINLYRYSYLVALCTENIGKTEVPKVTMTKEEAKAVYDENPDAYNTRTVSHILISPAPADEEEDAQRETDEDGNAIYTDEEWAAAQEEALEIIAKLEKGEDFAKLAEENSDDPGSAQNGGALEGAFSKEDSQYVEEFTEASFALTTVGEYTIVPVKSQFGYHIIKLDEITSEADIDEIIENIRNEDLETKRGEAATNYIDAFKEDSVIRYFAGSKAGTSSEDEAEATTENSDAESGANE